jgi:phosphoglycerol transferase
MPARVALLIAGVLLVFADSVAPAITFYRDQLRAAEIRLSEAQVIAESVEAEAGQNCAIFQLPYIPFPESAPLNELGVYDPLWLGLAEGTNMWSYGGIAGSQQDAWLLSVESRLPDSVVELKARGFCGVLLDERGFTPATFADAQQRLGERLGPPVRLQGSRQPGKESVTEWFLWRLQGDQ